MALSSGRRRAALAVGPLLLANTLAGVVCADALEGPITLRDAQEAALRARPELLAAELEQRALEAAERQASLLPNPSLSLEVEDVAGSGAYRGAGEAQTTLRVLQPLEVGGDRAARRAVAAEHRRLASYDSEALRLDVLAQTARAFVAVLIAQEELHHATELVELAEREQGAAVARVRAGAALVVDATRARAALAEARIHEARGRNALVAARRRLAAAWGDDEPRFERGEGDLHRVSPPPPLADLAGRLAASPDLARFGAERAERDARLAAVRARRIPDPLLGAGVRHLAGSNDASLVFEVAVPLPVFDRQQGALAEAEERAAKVSADRAAAARAARTALAAEYARWSAAHDEVVALRDGLLPDAQRARSELAAAHRDGRVSQLEVLAAARAEFEAVDRMLHQLGEYHEARITAERLVGAAVDELR
jgi:cobalt-zinc-cadmium efflux system outer membrane protein